MRQALGAILVLVAGLAFAGGPHGGGGGAGHAARAGVALGADSARPAPGKPARGSGSAARTVVAQRARSLRQPYLRRSIPLCTTTERSSEDAWRRHLCDDPYDWLP
jgi:hypothetical protein